MSMWLVVFSARRIWGWVGLGSGDVQGSGGCKQAGGGLCAV